MRRTLGVVYLVLVGLLLGIIVGEVGVVGRVIEAAEVRSTGRLPLRNWEISSPTHFSSRSGLWWISPGDEERALYHGIAYPEGMRGAKGLELELIFPPIAFSLYNLEERGGFQLSIESAYIGRELKVETYSGQELAVISRATGGENEWSEHVILTVPLDPDYKLHGVFLRFEGELMWIGIERAELILR